MSRVYMGCNITAMGRNSWGGRWEAYAGGTFVAADSLSGVKQMIREELKKESI